MSLVNILVVDDRPEGILSIRAVLDSKDYHIMTANSGQEALKCLLERDFAVILMDVQMPGLNGFETAQIIKTREKSQHIPIIFMSALNQDEKYVYEGYEVGAVDYLLKPFDPYILRSKVNIFVDIYKKNLLIKEQAEKIYENELKNYAMAMDRLELEGLRRYQHLADSIPHLVLKLQSDTSYEYFNKVWLEYTGLGPDESSGMKWKEAIHPQDLIHLNESFETGQANGRPFECECRIRSKNKEYRWHLLRMQPELISPKGPIRSWIGSATDFEDRKKDEKYQQFLAEAGAILVSGLNFEKNITEIAELSVQSFADWCAVDLVEGEKLGPFILVHHDPSKLELTKKFHDHYLEQMDAPVGAFNILKTGRSELYSELSDAVLVQAGLDIAHRKISEKLNNRTAIAIPLKSQNVVFGVLTFVAGDAEKQYSYKSLEVAEELGRRISLAYQNSHLYEISQEAIEVRNDFLSIASHELNTPITSLKLQLQMCLKLITSYSEDQKNSEKILKSIHSSIKQVDRLINLVEVLLDVSRIQSKRLTFDFEPTNFVEVVTELVERYKEVLKKADCELSVKLDQDIKVFWDKTRIEQVLINLLTNGIKYAPGKMELSVKKVGENVIIRFRDFGKGIPKEKLQNIFERYERIGASKGISGLGLGLFIVKQIIEGHHGKIDVETEEGKGTCFNILLPRDPKLNVINSDVMTH